MLTPADNRSSIVAFHLDRDPARARQLLESSGVQVSFREQGTQVRVSPALFNTGEEIRRFLDHMKRLA